MDMNDYGLELLARQKFAEMRAEAARERLARPDDGMVRRSPTALSAVVNRIWQRLRGVSPLLTSPAASSARVRHPEGRSA